MRFDDLVAKIISYPNGSITTKNNLYFSDIHLFVNIISNTVDKIQNKGASDEALLLKKQLEDLLGAIVNKNIRIKAVNARK
tara:strand:+ start:310 stop:552 length:243 start_codon:yes stop_codon:yes gene_type:complete